MTRARLPVLLLVLGALVGAVVAERSVDPSLPSADTGSPALELRGAAAVPAADALGSTWYCAAGSAATHTLDVINTTDEDRDAVVTVHPGTAEPIRVEVEVAADDVERLDLGDVAPDAPAAAALVEVDGGGVFASHTLMDEHGSDTGPCASTSSDRWFFAWGDTSRDARSLVALFNPFPGDAVVDFTFRTSDGTREPQALTGVVVPGRSVVVADVAAEVARRDQVSMDVVARTGRIVAERIQTFDGVEDRTGLSVLLGTPAPELLEVHAFGRIGESVDQQLVLYNPGEGPAEVDVEIALPSDVIGGVDPFELTVRPRGYQVLPLSEEGRLLDVFGIDDGEFTVTVRSLNEVGVISELITFADGASVSAGTSRVATEQVLPSPDRDALSLNRLRLVNLSPEDAVTVEVLRLAGGRRLVDEGEVELDPAGRAVLDLDDIGADPAAVVVTSSGPVVAELVTRWDEPSDLTVTGATPSVSTVRRLDQFG